MLSSFRRRRHSASAGKESNEVEEKNNEAMASTHTGGSRKLPTFWKLFVPILAFRLANAVMVQTYFNPDEYWQSLEVAHRLVFGSGYLTWEWREGLRGYLHPLIFAALYKTLALLGLDTPMLLRLMPRLLQGVFAAVGDCRLFFLAARVFSSNEVAYWALACNLVNWFTFFCITRTFSSCLEASLALVALSHWPSLVSTNHSAPSHMKDGTTETMQHGHLTQHRRRVRPRPMGSRQRALWLAAVACVVRPTSAILWLYMGAREFLMASDRWRFVWLEVLPIGTLVLSASTLLDRWMYGRWELVPVNFVRFNVLQSGASLYGTHPWHWYFSQGFPAMLATFVPLVGLGIWWSRRRHLAGLLTWTLALYSCLGHKEFRFVLPVLSIAMAYAGYALAILANHWRPPAQTPPPHPPSQASPTLPSRGTEKGRATVGGKRGWTWSPKFGALLVGLAITQLGPALYFSLIHQRGTVAVMPFLEREAASGAVREVLFLMPCHSTPFHSHIHHPVPMTILDCSPRLTQGHVSESDGFLKHPSEFVEQRFASSQGGNSPAPPSHLVLFDIEETKLDHWLQRMNYTKVAQFFHSHFPVDRERQAHVAVYRQTVEIQ